MTRVQEHEDLRKTMASWIDNEVNPHVDEWEKAGIFPAHQVFRSLGSLGLLGITKPVEYGGQALDFSYAAVLAEALGGIKCGGIPLAIGVQTDMCTPALAVHGNDDLRKELAAHVRKVIGPTATPDLIQFSPGLPKTRSGKIMRRILRKIAEDQFDNLGDTSTLAEPAVVDDLVHNRQNRKGAA